MRVLALRLVVIDGPCPWCKGKDEHTQRCMFYGQPGVVPPNDLPAGEMPKVYEIPYTRFEETSLEMFRKHHASNA